MNVHPSASTDCEIVPCLIKHHIVFPEWILILFIIQTKYPASRILVLQDSSDLVGAQTETRSGDVRTRKTRCMNKRRASWSSYLSPYRCQNIREITWTNCEQGRCEHGSVRNMVDETDWLNVLVDRGKNKVTSFKLTKCDFAIAYPDTSVLFLFTVDANMSTSRGRKRMYPSTGLRATCLSPGRKRTRFLCLRVPG